MDLASELPLKKFGTHWFRYRVLSIAPTLLTALADNLFALLPTILWYLMRTQPLNSIGPSRLWVPLLGTVSHLNSALFRGICPAHCTSSLKLLFLPGLGAPLRSYLDVALNKFHKVLQLQLLCCIDILSLGQPG